MGKSLIFLLISFLFVSVLAKSQEKPLLLRNATLHLGNGQHLEYASIILDRGVFFIHRKNESIEEEKYKIIDLSGHHIYPFETLDKNESKAFILEFENLISLYSTMDSTLTARVFHNQLSENYFLGQTGSINLVVMTREWQEKRERSIRYVVYNGELIQRSF